MSILIVGGSSAFSKGATSPTSLMCRGGVIPPGTYSSLTITGKCSVPGGTVVVTGNVLVAPHATLDASAHALLDPTNPATLVVWGNVNVLVGATFALGCSTDSPKCTGLPLTDRIGGNLSGSGALMVIVWGTSIGGNASLAGGGGGAFCPSDGPPAFSDLTNNTVGANIVIAGLRTCWFGMFRNTIGGSVIVAGNVFGDPDAPEVGTNTVGGNLTCVGNSPAAQFGDSGAAPNTVSGVKTGECASL